ncbi:MAG: energy-coupling factor ABC transporter permease [Xanthomonadales bacterium]|jgi:uncharacterized membrane protein|nr:energy-coupling factor ABC transporter permease [Xanthomonadales bacterium]
MSALDLVLISAVVLLLGQTRRAAWQVARRRPLAVGLMACGIASLRLMQVELPGGVELELLGAALALLMLGSAAGSWTLCGGMLLAAAARGQWPGEPGAELLATVLLPGLIIPGLLLLRRSYRIREPFVYFLGIGFGGAALTMLAASLSHWVMASWAGLGTAAALSDAYLLAAPLMMFAEGFLTGALITGAVVYAPELLETWDDATLPRAS